MDVQNELNRKWDGLGTVLASLALLGGCLVLFVSCRLLASCDEIYAGIGGLDLPILPRFAMAVQRAHGFDLVALLLLALGIILLVLIKDRLRANLYAALTALLMAMGGAVLLVVSALPLITIVSTMGA